MKRLCSGEWVNQAMDNGYLLTPDSELNKKPRDFMVPDEVKSVLDRFIADEQPEFALMLSGEWGAGKSHLINKYFSRSSKGKVLTVSLFGLSSLVEIENAVIAEMSGHLSELGMATGKWSKFIGSAATLASDDRQLGGLTGAAAAIAGPIARSKLLNRINKGWVLVFEDLERSDASSPAILGFINRFVENKSCHVILIANEKKFKQDGNEYTAQKEKLVGVTLKLSLSPSEIAEVTSEKLDALDGAEVETATATIELFCEKTKIDNIRTIQFGLIQINELFRLAKSNHQNEDLNSLIRAYTITGLILAAGLRKWSLSPDSLFMVVQDLPSLMKLRVRKERNNSGESEQFTPEEESLLDFEKSILRKGIPFQVGAYSIHQALCYSLIDEKQALEEMKQYIGDEQSFEDELLNKYPTDFTDEVSFAEWTGRLLAVFREEIDHTFSAPQQVLNFCNKLSVLVKYDYLESPTPNIDDELISFGIKKIPECIYPSYLENPNRFVDGGKDIFYEAFRDLAQGIHVNSLREEVQSKIIDCLSGKFLNEKVNGMSFIENVAVNTFVPVLNLTFLDGFIEESLKTPVAMDVAGKFLHHRAGKITTTESLGAEKEVYSKILERLNNVLKDTRKGLLYAAIQRAIDTCENALIKFGLV